jgi:hypothetical protein
MLAKPSGFTRNVFTAKEEQITETLLVQTSLKCGFAI